MTTITKVDAWLAENGVPERVTAQQADNCAHAYSTIFGGGAAVRSPFRSRHPKVTLPRVELAAYLAGRANR